MTRCRGARFLSWRFWLICVVLCLLVLGIVSRLVYLSTIDRGFLLDQGISRSIRTISLPAVRGMITDRHGIPLAVSSPVNAVWADPKLLVATDSQVKQLAALLNMPYGKVHVMLDKSDGSEYAMLKRMVLPRVAQKIKALKIKGVYIKNVFHRFYPQAEVASQLVGLTNMDGKGQSGIELAANSYLTGKAGKERVEVNRLGQVVKVLETLQAPKPAHNLALSIDERIQYVAYRALAQAFKEHHAKFGSIVVMDPQTGEVLAMVNMPSFNPNLRPKDTDGRYQNRAVTSQFEPGSTLKTFAIVSALDSKDKDGNPQYTPETKISTDGGHLIVGGHVVQDDGQNYGVIDVTQVLKKSSNIGITKMTLSTPPGQLFKVLHRFGFGQLTGSGFPGEVPGVLVNRTYWRPFTLATLSFGYGMSATTLQLARAYSALANGGTLMPVSLIKMNKKKLPKGQYAVSKKVAKEVVKMLQSVVAVGGTGHIAAIPGYTVAGKTGTAYLAKPGGYYKHKYVSSFVGMAPATCPKLVVAVVLYDNTGERHFGGLAAAPAFKQVMSAALRLLDIQPDDLNKSQA